MPTYLVFDLFAPHGSFGAPSISAASSAFRWSELEPPRSALVGLLAAALGLAREEQGRVDRDFAFAVRVDVPPVRDPAPDYHTILPGRAPAGRDRWSRLQEQRHVLAGGFTEGSIISRREYWTAGCFTVVVARRDGTAEGLAEAAAALRRPAWPLYVGRRACPLGAPPDPDLVEAPDVCTALRTRPPLPERRPVFPDALRSRVARPRRILFDPDLPGAPEPLRTVLRRDRPAHLRQGDGVLLRRFFVAERGECLEEDPR